MMSLYLFATVSKSFSHVTFAFASNVKNGSMATAYAVFT